MPHAETNHKPQQKLTLRPLTESQHRAITLLLSGANDGEIAAAVGVVRETVWSWRHSQPLFMAELQRRREELYGAACEQLRAILSKAIANLAAAVESGNLRASIEVLKAAGVYGNGEINRIRAQHVQACFDEIVETRLNAERIIEPMQMLIDRDQHPYREQRRREIWDELVHALDDPMSRE